MSKIKVESIQGLSVPDDGPELLLDSSGNLNYNSGTFYIDSTSNRVGINTDNPTCELDVNGIVKADELVFPTVTNTTRPISAQPGTVVYNDTEGTLQVWNGEVWSNLGRKKIIEAIGGTILDANIGGIDYRIHAFTGVGTSSFNVLFAPVGAQIDILVVAGGGGGGAHVPGGGGAGGLIYKPNVPITSQAYQIVVGQGGIGSLMTGGGVGMPNATAGGNSSAFGLTAIGGGFAGSWTQDTRSNNGGSGGGRNTDRNSGQRIGIQPSQSGDSGAFGFGNNGGISLDPSAANYGGGGGGGAGAPGQNPTNRNIGGNGGIGRNYSTQFGTFFGQNGWFAGGGGGGGWGIVNPIGDGGLGGGGNGDCPTGNGTGVSARRGSGDPTGFSGLPNTGGGGGGAGRAGDQISRGGNGGSGVVLIRYPISEIPTTVISDGLILNLDAANPSSYPGSGTTWFDMSGNGYDFTIYGSPTFNSSGYFTFANNQITQYMMRFPFETPTQDITYSCWFRSNFVSANQTPFTYSVNGDNEMLFFINNSTQLAPHPKSVPFPINTTNMTDVWVNFSWTRITSTGQNIFYRDGQYIGEYTNSAGIPITPGGHMIIGQEADSPGGGFDPNQNLDGDFARLDVYNRSLTAQEIQQNFNALRGRFGL